MHKKLLAIFAHPDDESFGPGGTLAKYAREGVEIHLQCATKGERGGRNYESRIRNYELKKKKNTKIHEIRAKELLEAARVLGIAKVEFLDFIDGQLCNAIYHQLAEKIIKKINEFKPQVVLTSERRGISGHLDHIAVSMTTTYAFLKTKVSQKLYYNCLLKGTRDRMRDDYFVYFPEGYPESEITTKIDYTPYWKLKKEAMLAHQSQLKDVRALLTRFTKFPKVDHFILQYHRGVKVSLPETDLFAGINSPD